MAQNTDELLLDDRLDRIQSNVPDDTFNARNQEQAQRDIQGLFGEKAKTSFHNITAWYVCVLGWIILLVIVAVILIRIIHLLAPENFLWLSPDRISQIDTIIFAALTGIAARFFPGHRE